MRASISAPDLLILDVPLHAVSYEAPRIRFEAEELGETLPFDGTVRGDTIQGSLRLLLAHGTSDIPFTLTRGEAPHRSYSTIDVEFTNAGVQLSGTLYLPAVAAPHPAVVLLQGSSLNLRDPYRFYADRFARIGVAALVFDKRGNGRSSGDYERATMDDLLADAAAAVHMLAARDDIDAARIGVWGLSQGAMLAPLVAQRAPVAFVIAVSGPGVPFGEAAAFQDSVRLVRRGFTEREGAQAAAMHRRLTEWIRRGDGDSELAAHLQRVADLPWRRQTGIPRRLPTADRTTWYWAMRPLDPVRWWEQLRVPALVVYGADDALLPTRSSAARIARALRVSGHPESRVLVFPRGDHMIKGSPSAGNAVQTWSWPRAVPGYMDSVTHWLRQRALR